MKRYNGKYAEGFRFDKPNQDIVFGERSTLTVDGTTITIESEGIDLVLGGEVSASEFAVYSIAHDTSISIQRGGTIDAGVGVLMTGRDQSLTNAGEIVAMGSGVIVTGSNSHVANHGTITANAGIVLQAAEDSWTLNGRDGEIQATFGVVFSPADEGAENRLMNLGSIVSQAYAFSGGGGIDRVSNRGFIDGGIFLGNGDDTFDDRRGTTTGQVRGSSGNDRYIIDDASIRIVEEIGDGNDVVISSVNFHLPDNFEKLILSGKRNLVGHGNGGDNVMVGNAGDNWLNGYDGENVYLGGRGDDVLIGGSGKDIYAFGTGDDHDTIRYFQDGTDHLDLSDWKGLSDFDVLLSHAREKNGNLIISFNGDQLTIESLTKVQLDAGDFVV